MAFHHWMNITSDPSAGQETTIQHQPARYGLAASSDCSDTSRR
ncbi:hypothetical protein SACS_1676 [Parasaccharibacter apium]|uniref:Uncharacterized protein n=1 Tax=Parasaccharibacter apium TaxID=1510841 RepID=A0A7U7J1I4_9PROT|nr:hypothetical protein SACS_1676 [Parasaccharibacter apium]